MEYKNGYIDFYTLTVGELLRIDELKCLVVNVFIFFSDTYIRDLKKAELQCLFDEDTLEDVVQKYPYEKYREVRYDVRQRLDSHAKNGGFVMYISQKDIAVITRNDIHYIKRDNFDSAIRTITGSEVIV